VVEREEDGYHAVVACTKSRALREELRKEWELISEDILVRSVPEWFLLLLDKLDTEERAHVFFSAFGEPGTCGMMQCMEMALRRWRLRQDL